MMDVHDIDLRNTTYRLFVEFGRAPTVEDVANAVARSTADVLCAWKRLHDQHALVLDPATNELRMANPFSAVPTAYRVRSAGRGWYATCAWDAFGIRAALHSDGAKRPVEITSLESFAHVVTTSREQPRN